MTTASRYAVRAAGPEDLQTLSTMIGALNAHFGMPVATGPGDLEAAFLGPNALVFGYLALDDEAPVGYALCQPFFDTDTSRMATWLLDLYVGPEQRGAGLGRALIARVAADAVAKGHAMVGLAVYDDNPVRNLYLKLGAGLDSPAQVMELRGEALDRLARAPHL